MTREQRIMVLAERIAYNAQAACFPDGETAEGFPKMRMQTPEEVAKRAVDVAEALFAEGEKRGYLSTT